MSDTRWDTGHARAALARGSAWPPGLGTDVPQAEKAFSEQSLLGESQGESSQVQEENTPCLSPCTLDHGHFTNCQLRGCRERCNPISISPEWRHWRLRKAKFLVHRGPVGKSQASCLLRLCSLQLLFPKIHRTHSHSYHLKRSLAIAKMDSLLMSHETPGLTNTAPLRGQSLEGWAAGSEQHPDTTAEFSCRRDRVLMGRRTGFCFFGFNFQNSTLYPVECTHSQFLFRGQLQTSLWRLSEL